MSIRHGRNVNSFFFLGLCIFNLFNLDSWVQCLRLLDIQQAIDSPPPPRTTLCDPFSLGSLIACYDVNIPPKNIFDYPLNNSMVSSPDDGMPWGISISGPYPDSVSYLLSWKTGRSHEGSLSNILRKQMDSGERSEVVLIADIGGATPHLIHSKGSHYIRAYDAASGYEQFSYLSPTIHHVLLRNLTPGYKYTYLIFKSYKNGTVSDWPLTSNKVIGSQVMSSLIQDSLNGTTSSAVFIKRSFRTVQKQGTMSSPDMPTYPLRIGLIGDIGQTENSTQTRNHLQAHLPQLILNMGDLSYADNYQPDNPERGLAKTESELASNQRRWDSMSVL
ncbi:hypothetical protein CEUSTIGMA_g5115.t1 [Chlamydomonas eustigma]|uniref:Purple acid phosphatase N-terminal domain-containing protein n=1 Tax=Chlamydomonas eustigma TaxID=1157962 RepID=A0A250X453_9CHLO|nr:hypothetical protein CEUSTIGMA_g5115.t1 [Chlamydomonas eustigma]|eukprot:GAX77672.1 hypothetical protein CEUSTIGMA_g5115.t1 [Chlamydomonas eustigma]